MLNNTNLQSNKISDLKAIKQLRTNSVLDSSWKNNNNNSNDEQGCKLYSNSSSKDIYDYMTYHSISKNRNKRSIPSSFKRRMSAITASITENITEKPTKQRSSSLKAATLSVYQRLALNRLFTKHQNNEKKSKDSEPNEQMNNNLVTMVESNELKSEYQDINNFFRNANNVSSEDESCNISPTNSDCTSDNDKLQANNFYRKDSKTTCSSSASTMSSSSAHSIEIDNLDDSDLPWSIHELEKTELINQVNEWSFPIFKFYEKSNHYVLSKLAYKIFHDVGLFDSFDIPIPQFINFFHALECGYKDLPYHNRIHAADVLHVCYYLSTQSIPYFVSTPNEKNAKLVDRPKLNPLYFSSANNGFDSEVNGCLGTNFLPLELLALYCSAAMHDFDHPGRNNQFLVATNSPLALLYNDRSVLENHHASSSWLLLKSDEKFNFLRNLDSIEWKRLRYLVVENILATDLFKHYSLLDEFKSKTCPNSESHGLDWKSEADRLLVSQIILKMADISTPLKDRELHVQWTDRIMEEFYEQGEEELRFGLPISPYMDRQQPQVAKLQEYFIKNLVGSIFNAYNTAGFLPGRRMNKSKNQSSDENEQKKNIYSEISSNYHANLEMWIERVKLEGQQQVCI